MKGHQLQEKMHNVCLLNTFASFLHSYRVATWATLSSETLNISDLQALVNFEELLGDLLAWRLYSAQAGLGTVCVWELLKKT